MYKKDWEIQHNTFRQKEVKALKEHYKYCQKTKQSCTFEKWLEELGYSGELFVCKEEFFSNEYQDEAYVKGLLGDEDLFNQYQEDRAKESA